MKKLTKKDILHKYDISSKYLLKILDDFNIEHEINRDSNGFIKCRYFHLTDEAIEAIKNDVKFRGSVLNILERHYGNLRSRHLHKMYIKASAALYLESMNFTKTRIGAALRRDHSTISVLLSRYRDCQERLFHVIKRDVFELLDEQLKGVYNG